MSQTCIMIIKKFSKRIKKCKNQEILKTVKGTGKSLTIICFWLTQKSVKNSLVHPVMSCKLLLETVWGSKEARESFWLLACVACASSLLHFLRIRYLKVLKVICLSIKNFIIFSSTLDFFHILRNISLSEHYTFYSSSDLIVIYEKFISTCLKTKEEKIIFASNVLVCSFAKQLSTAGSVL